MSGSRHPLPGKSLCELHLFECVLSHQNIVDEKYFAIIFQRMQIISCVKFNKEKCQILHLEDSGHLHRLENDWLESSPVEADLRVLIDGKLNMNQQCPGSQEGQPCPGVHQAQHHQLGKAGIALLCSALGQPHLSAGGVLGAPIQEQYRAMCCQASKTGCKGCEEP
ncbi:hypothetical protein TURU_030536 [Turdus rufiventris]|nr:hypothetical protein TURU_030536 [Turdus rufiventris]